MENKETGKRKIGVTNERKINGRFHISKELFLTTGFVNGTLDPEVRLCRQQSVKSFAISTSTWEKLIPRLPVLAGWTAAHETNNFEIVLNDNPNEKTMVVAYHNICHIKDMLKEDSIVLNSMETAALNRVSGAVNEHLIKVNDHEIVFTHMADIIIEFYNDIYDNLYGDYERIPCLDGQPEKFDAVIGYFTNFITSYQVVTKFNTVLQEENLENYFYNYNLFSVISGQITYLKTRMHLLTHF